MPEEKEWRLIYKIDHAIEAAIAESRETIFTAEAPIRTAYDIRELRAKFAEEVDYHRQKQNAVLHAEKKGAEQTKIDAIEQHYEAKKVHFLKALLSNAIPCEVFESHDNTNIPASTFEDEIFICNTIYPRHKNSRELAG